MVSPTEKQPREANGRFGQKLYCSPRGRMVPASGRNREERQETLGLMIGLVNTPTQGRSQREVNALLVIGEALAIEVEEDYAQLKKEQGARDRADSRKRATRRKD
ncbi:hypothetical protein K2P56_02245 [Patescibacteria group bacterium]|nr:hypothetical protein [Patescibacteria group bacterium]